MSFSDLLDSAQSGFMGSLGEAVTYYFDESHWERVNGIFENNYLSVDEAGFPVSSSSPEIDFKLSDLSSYPKKGDRIKIRDVFYKVNEIIPDGRGIVKLTLRESLS